MSKGAKNSENLETPKQKRDRSVNFTQEETEVLISLVELRIPIIETKKSDAATWQDKEKAWKYVESAFNIRLGQRVGAVYRDHKSLKLKYEALKRDTRKKVALLNKTDGSAASIPGLTPVEQKIKQFMLYSVEGNDSLDSDYALPSASTLEPLVSWAHTDEQSVPPPTEQVYVDAITKNILVEIKEEAVEPPQKRICEVPREEQDQSKPKGKRPFDKLIKKKIELAQLQKEIMTEELEQKFIQRQILEQELEHKNIVHDLEKQHLLLKIELLKKGFEKY